jgi:hypothetical protein
MYIKKNKKIFYNMEKSVEIYDNMCYYNTDPYFINIYI